MLNAVRCLHDVQRLLESAYGRIGVTDGCHRISQSEQRRGHNEVVAAMNLSTELDGSSESRLSLGRPADEEVQLSQSMRF